jgi:hypothetical protein
MAEDTPWVHLLNHRESNFMPVIKYNVSRALKAPVIAAWSYMERRAAKLLRDAPHVLTSIRGADIMFYIRGTGLCKYYRAA